MATEAKTENLSKYLFSAPVWWQSLIIIIVLGLLVDGAVYVLSGGTGTMMYGVAFAAAAVAAMLLTKPLVDLLGTEKLTWNRSALVALASMIFSLLWMAIGFALNAALAYVLGLGFILAIRLMVLTAICDYRIGRMFLPAAVQTVAGIIFGVYLFGTGYLLPAVLSILVFSLAIITFLLLFDRPLRKAHGISAMQFINAFLAHLTDGSKGLEEYFRTIGEAVTVPETSFFFRREGKKDVLFVVPNLHPICIPARSPRSAVEIIPNICMICSPHKGQCLSHTAVQHMISTLFRRASAKRLQKQLMKHGRIFPIHLLQADR